MSLERVETIMQKHGAQPSNLIEVLLDVQEEFRYLPGDVLKMVGARLSIPLSRVYHVATFYNAFSLTPRGKHHVCVCTGTPCHALGAWRIVEAFERHLNVKCGGTTQDLMFTLETSGCVGTCGLAPIVIVGSDLYGLVTPVNAPKLLKKYQD